VKDYSWDRRAERIEKFLLSFARTRSIVHA